MAGFADLEQRLARGIAADLAKSTHPLHLRRLHREEELRQGQVGEMPVHRAQSIAQYRDDMQPRTGVVLQKRQYLASIQYRQAAVGRGGCVGRTVLAVEQGNFAEQLARAQNSEHQCSARRQTRR